MTSGLKHVLIAQIRALASTSYAIFHIVCSFSHCTPVFHIFVWQFLKLQSICLHLIHFSYEWRIFFIHSTIHSILQRILFIQQIIHSKKIWNYSFKEIIHSFEKWIIAQGYSISREVLILWCVFIWNLKDLPHSAVHRLALNGHCTNQNSCKGRV